MYMYIYIYIYIYSCAAFTLGDASKVALVLSASCPKSYSYVSTAGACVSAAAVANRTYVGSVAFSYFPQGCFWHTVTGGVYYNTYIAGTANTFAQPLCAGAAPPRAASLDIILCM